MHQVIIIGAGFSGICMGIKLREKGIEDFLILEKADDLGGTWRENTYPGAECDIPSALYSYSFEPNPNWEYKWSHQPQILEYIQHCARKYHLEGHFRFSQELYSATYQEEKGYWKLKTKDGQEYETQSLISAVGQLHHPRFPELKGREDFKGPSWHSAEWDHSVSLEGKRVGVIGNAASAVQFIPQIAKTAQELHVFQRSANWMIPKNDRPYYELEKKIAAQFPFLLKMYRWQLWGVSGGLVYNLMGQNKTAKKLAEAYSKKYLRSTIQDPALQEKLIPDYPIGAKRILFSDDYYPALNQDHVQVHTEKIIKISSSGLELDGVGELPLDVLIYGTGFHTNPFLLGLDIQGKKGLSLQKAWEKGAEAYLGISCTNFPNLFMMYGPNTNLGHNSIIIMSECQANYISQCIETLVEKDFKSMEVKADIQEEFNLEMQERLANSAWNQIKASWYRIEGKITNNWPGKTSEYAKRTRNVNYSNYHLETSKV